MTFLAVGVGAKHVNWSIWIWKRRASLFDVPNCFI